MNNETAGFGFIHRYLPSSGGYFIAGSGGYTCPTLLMLHGTGGNENDLVELGRSLAPGAHLLSPRGKVLENGMPRFFRRLAKGVFDLEDLQRRTHELADFIGQAARHYSFDPENVIAIGYSNGANIAASLMLLRPQTLKSAVLLRAMVPLEPAELPDLKGKSIFMAEGRTDPIVPVENAERLVAMFRHAGANVILRWENTGHGLAHAEIAAVDEWLKTQLF